jgi:DNA-binding transcriptional ArsR family regulator
MTTDGRSNWRTSKAMSPRDRNDGTARRRAHAAAFAALGDQTRLALVAKLSDGRKYSISQLSDAQPFGGSNHGGSKLTRQAITKHLRVLERARIVHGVRAGRESLFELDPKPMDELREYLDRVSAQWDVALGRLKAFLEE